MKSRTFFLLLVLTLSVLSANAETPVQAWAQRYSYPTPLASTDQAQKVVTDASGNVIVAGETYLVGTEKAMLIIKYAASGAPLWTNIFYQAGYDSKVTALAVDSTDNVFVAGSPSNLAVGSSYKIVKYSSAGLPLWTNGYWAGFGTTSQALGLAVDASGNAIVTGTSGSVGLTIKYSPAGARLWMTNFTGAAAAVALDASGNVFVAGISGTPYRFAIYKYSPAGMPLWSNFYSPSSWGFAKALVVDTNGNVFVTGIASLDNNYFYVTMAYSGAGTPLWINRYNGSSFGTSAPNTITRAANGNVFITAGAKEFNAFDFVTVVYSAAGLSLRTNRYAGLTSGNCRAMALAPATGGNVLVTGYAPGSSSDDFVTIAYSGAGLPLWTNHYSGPGYVHDQPNSVAVDTSGNVFVAGYSGGSTNGYDFATLKYSSSGAPLWTNTFNYNYGEGNDDDQACAVALAPSGNLLVTGSSRRTGSAKDYATLAYSPAGTPLWTNRYNGPGNDDDEACAVKSGPDGNVFVTGSSYNVINRDYATIAYSDAGLPLWTNRYDGPAGGDDQSRALQVDLSGNVLVTGTSARADGGQEFATIKYSGAGVPLWTNCYNHTPGYSSAANALAVDDDGNVFVVGGADNGSGLGYAIIAYSAAGLPLWTNRYVSSEGGFGVASAVVVDHSGNVLVTGQENANGSATIKYSTAGLPLWTNQYYLYSATAVAVDASNNVFVAVAGNSYAGSWIGTIAYSSGGVLLWVNAYNGSSTAAGSAGVAVDVDGNVFMAGSPNGNYMLLKYSNAGVPLWTAESSYWTEGRSACLAIGPDGAAYVAGAFKEGLSPWAPTPAYDYVTLKYISQPEIASEPASRSNSFGATVTFTVSATGSAPLRYQWQRDGTNLLNAPGLSGANSSTLTLANVQADAAAGYAVVITNAFGSITSSLATLTLVAPSSMMVGSASATNGTLTFSFTNTPGASFTVLTTTNLGSPLSNWTPAGEVTEILPGQFLFTDSEAAANHQRFYRVRSP